MEVFTMDGKAEKMALFRYGLVAPLVLEPLPRGELIHRAREIAARQYEIPGSKRISLCPATLLKWARLYRQGGFDALGRKARQDRGQFRAITPQLAELIERLKRENPHRAGTTLLRELALCSGSTSAPIGPATLYRFLQQRGLTARQLLAPPGRKKFEAEFSNQVWQSDMLFGPYVVRPGGGRMQAFLFAVLDDASRLIPHAQFYDNQGLDAFLDCLRHAVASRGVPSKLYVDNGKVFRCQQLARLAASLGFLISHTPPYQPEGRGKIERFFRTVREQFLANLDPKRCLTLEELNERLWTWIEQVYHRTEHAGLATTPLARWQRDIERVRQLRPDSDLHRLFFYRLDRRVRRDSTFMLHSHFYEVPPHLAGETVEVHFDPRDLSQVEIYFQGRSQGWARAVDPVVNAQLPGNKAEASPTFKPTGVNFIELLQKQKAKKE
jgi:transposase InsO family protein